MPEHSAFPKAPESLEPLDCFVCVGGVLPLCRSAVGVFYSPSWLDNCILSFKLQCMKLANCEQTSDQYQIKLLVLDSNTWNHLTVCNQICSDSYENNHCLQTMRLQIIYTYVLSSTDRLFLLYPNTSVWLDTRDALSWDRKPAEFTPFGYLTIHQKTQRKRNDFNAYVSLVFLGFFWGGLLLFFFYVYA